MAAVTLDIDLFGAAQLAARITHHGESDDIGNGVAHLASDESKLVTGVELIIDGGYTAQ